MAGDTEATPASLWKQLYGAAPSQAKIDAAASLLRISTLRSRDASWLFQWLSGNGAGGLLSKKTALSLAGMRLLCALIEELPEAFPLAFCAPLLVAQIRLMLDNLVATSTDGASLLGLGDPNEASAVLEVHVRLVELLLQRPAMSFRPTREQASPLWTTSVTALSRVVAAEAAGHSAEMCSNLSNLVASLGHFLLRALDALGPKKAFRGVVDIVPSIAELHASLGGRQQEVPSPQQSAIAVTQKLLRVCVAPVHMENYENLVRLTAGPSRATAEDGRPAAKKKRKASDGGQEEQGDAYQLAIFRALEGLLATPASTKGCLYLMPLLLEGFVSEYRVVTAGRSAAAAQVGSEETVEKALATMAVPCEFWFFMKLSEVLQASLSRKGEEPSGVESEVVSCLVDLWRKVRMHGLYRPREDPKMWQSKTLQAFCKLLIRRLTQLRSGAEGIVVGNAPEWQGLCQALHLDATPLEDKLEQLWALIADLCPLESANDEPQETACVSFAVQLFSTYARLADFAGCVAALSTSFRQGPDRRAEALARNRQLLQGLQQASKDVSIDAAAAQAKKVWTALLSELRGLQGAAAEAVEPKKKKRRSSVIEVPSSTSSWWAAVLLREVLYGLRTSELSLDDLRDLTIETFSVLDDVRVHMKPEDADSLALALCVFGRRLGAWDFPPLLKPLVGPQELLASKVAAELKRLVKPIPKRLRTKPEALTPYHIDAAAHFLAMEDTTLGNSTETESQAVVASLVQLASEERTSSPEVMARVKEVICSHAPLLLRQVAADEKSALEDVIRRLLPEDWECWPHVSRAQLSQPTTSLDEADKEDSLPPELAKLPWLAVRSGISQGRREEAISCITARLSAVVASAPSGSTSSDVPQCSDMVAALAPALPLMTYLAQVLHSLSYRQVLHHSVAAALVYTVQGLLAVTLATLREVRDVHELDCLIKLLCRSGEVVRSLFGHLSAPLAAKRTATKKAHQRIADAETFLLHLASQVAQTALRMQPQAALAFSERLGEVKVRLSAEQYGSLLATVNSLMTALFSARRCDGSRLPAWARKPHVVVGTLKLLLEGVYQAWDGTQAVQLASSIARLWEAYSLGGSRLVPRAARKRSTQVSTQGQLQNATKGFVIMLLGHALEQQRRWAGMDAAVQRSLKAVLAENRVQKRAEELAKWKEAVSILQVGLNPLFQSLESGEHLKQCLYVSLREPLNTMFKEAHEGYRKRGKYKGEA